MIVRARMARRAGSLQGAGLRRSFLAATMFPADADVQDDTRGVRRRVKPWPAERARQRPTSTRPEGNRNGGIEFTSWKGYQVHTPDQA